MTKLLFNFTIARLYLFTTKNLLVARVFSRRPEIYSALKFLSFSNRANFREIIDLFSLFMNDIFLQELHLRVKFLRGLFHIKLTLNFCFLTRFQHLGLIFCCILLHYSSCIWVAFFCFICLFVILNDSYQIFWFRLKL